MTARVALAVLLAAACNSGSKSSGAGSGTGSARGTGSGSAKLTGWESGCTQALREAPSRGAVERYAMIAQACPVCGIEWTPLYGTPPDRLAVDRVLAACGGACNPRARDEFLDGFDAVLDPRKRNKPWRTLHQQCGDPNGLDKEGRFASAPWYVLTQISRVLTAASPPVKVRSSIEIPLPAVGTNGRGLELPPAKNVAPGAPRVHVTVLAAEVRVGRAPVAVLGLAGLAIDGTVDYPGAVVAVPKLAAEIERVRAGSKQPPLVLAPTRSPAPRLREVIAAIEKLGPHLAVVGPAPAAGWDDIPVASPIVLRASPGAGERVVVGLGPRIVVGHAKQRGAARDACIATEPGWVARNIVLDPGAEVVVALDSSTTVETVAALIDDLAGIRVASVALVDAAWPGWPRTLGACQ